MKSYKAIWKSASVTLVSVFLIQTICLSPAFAQGGEQLVKTQYYENKNITQVTMNPIVLASRKLEELRMGAISGYPGKVKSKPKEVALIFLSISKLDENRYEVARKLLVVADERKFDWGETQRTKQSQGGVFVETMTVAIPADDFIFVSNAKQVKLKLGLTEVDLTPAHINALRVMVSYLE